jgi:DHA2 family methylenomycin A resistance protein-like MFS transporter
MSSTPRARRPDRSATEAALPRARRLAAGLVTGTRQLGAVLGVAVLGAVLAAVADTSLTDDADRFARGFAAAMLVAAAVAASAALLAWRSMPSRAATPRV